MIFWFVCLFSSRSRSQKKVFVVVVVVVKSRSRVITRVVVKFAFCVADQARCPGDNNSSSFVQKRLTSRQNLGKLHRAGRRMVNAHGNMSC
mmetsp:Transcript_2050/g.4726  ORF Transcript_2050/g.4726 Transcript_2050/m.4726 type:complete len:91 (+) Transcript_2050:602-874(+)